ncbi:MAG: hypothetical protein R3Y22_05025 [Bacteroidales bacterium]
MEDSKNNTPRGMRYLFGIIMIVIYLGMGILALMNFFNWNSEIMPYVAGIFFIAYGIWRGYRQFKMMG